MSKILTKIINHMSSGTRQNSRQVVTFGIVMAINHPLYQYIWYMESAENYENTGLRLIATLLSVGLALSPYWPTKLKRLLPVYWYCALCFCLPFFFTFMTLKNHLGAIWLMNSMSALYCMFLVIDFISASCLVLIGFAAGIMAFRLTTPILIIAPGLVTMNGLIATYGAGFVIAGIFARNNEIIRQEKFAALYTLSASVAHEFRTPLAAIKFAMAGLSNYLPALISGYSKARENLADVKPIRGQHLSLLSKMPMGVERLIYQANMSIDLMLMNARQLKIDTQGFKICSIAHCIHQSMASYPFKSETQELQIHIADDLDDFAFWGDESLVIHIFYNLMKNAFYFIDAVEKGDIYIWTKTNARTNQLFFRDTAKGVKPEVLKDMFKQFYSSREGGTGVGLSFCKMVMEASNGDIQCQSQEGVHTTFILTFPLPQS